MSKSLMSKGKGKRPGGTKSASSLRTGSRATVRAKDFYDDDAPAVLQELLAGPADVVLSDMAASATGDTQTDHLRIMALAETAHDFARQVLKEGGTFVAKVLRGGTERSLLDRLKRDFAKVRHIKPQASR